MTSSTKIDIASLLKEASALEQRESYKMVEKTQNYRIGIGVRLSVHSSSFFLELIIYHHSPDEHFPFSDPRQLISFLKTLQERGYVISCQEETCTALERMLPQDLLSNEVSYLKKLIRLERKKIRATRLADQGIQINH